ncbi:hypothetical protein [Methanoregula sp.]|uniref:hypothetical protein n=1 Tax=Methanoregula sp. TaxID=2052170 RepID=UPI00356408CE
MSDDIGIGSTGIVKDKSPKSYLNLKLVLLIVLGIVSFCLIAFVPSEYPNRELIVKILETIGAAFMVAAVVSFFYENYVRKESEEKFSRDLAESLMKSNELAENIANKLVNKYHISTGLRLLCSNRKSCQAYSSWAKKDVEYFPQIVRCLGRSVLHQINTDFQNRGMTDLCAIMVQKLGCGSHFSIIFTYPLSEYLGQIAVQEDRPLREIQKDLLNSLKICVDLYLKLQEVKIQPNNQMDFSLNIYLYSKSAIQMCYHEVEDILVSPIQRKIIVGFYLDHHPDFIQPAFEVQDPKAQTYFNEYYKNIKMNESILFLHWEQPERVPKLDIKTYETIYENFFSTDRDLLKDIGLIEPKVLQQKINDWTLSS